jgi:hypothetical protein
MITVAAVGKLEIGQLAMWDVVKERALALFPAARAMWPIAQGKGHQANKLVVALRIVHG